MEQCDARSKICVTSDELVAHNVPHTNQEPYKCRHCDQAFVDLAILLCHEKTHAKNKPYKCNSCEKSFSMAAALICHTRIHTGERPYSCDVCQKTFTQSGLYTIQLLSVN